MFPTLHSDRNENKAVRGRSTVCLKDCNNNILVVRLTEQQQKKNSKKTVKKIVSCENYTIWELYKVCGIEKTVSLS